jgi:hypothetical protein
MMTTTMFGPRPCCRFSAARRSLAAFSCAGLTMAGSRFGFAATGSAKKVSSVVAEGAVTCCAPAVRVNVVTSAA